MKKLLLILVILSLTVGLSAQTIDPKQLDLSEAMVSIAGPDKVYVRSIYYAGEELSVLLQYDGMYGADIYGPYFQEDKLLLDSYNLDYVQLRAQGSDAVAVSNIIVDGYAYSGILKYAGEAKMSVASYWETTPPMTRDEQIAMLNAKIKNLEAESAENEELIAWGEQYIADGKKYVAELENKNADNEALIAEGRAYIAKGEAYIAEGETYVAQLENENAQLKEGKTIIETEKIVYRDRPGAAVAVVELPTRSVLSGFSGGTAALGDWQASYSSVKQVDAAQKFAKYVIPLRQNASETLFSIKAKVPNQGWVGYGLHFFASDVVRSKGYGFGKSYLLWVTKDPGVHQTARTYVQLYRSYDDIRLVQLASVTIPQPITSVVETKVHYNRSANQLTVYVNGDQALIYDGVDSALRSGDSLALRALGGTVEFTELSVKTK